LPVKPRKLSQFIHPMLAKESVSAFSDKDWIYEIKWDGYRAIAEINKKDVLLYSRNGNTFNESYPVVVEALQKMNIKAVLDGEIVALDENGMPSFQFLQDYGNNIYPLVYYVFDILSLNGKDTTGLTLMERKDLLKKLLKKNEVIKYSDHIEEKGEQFFELAKEKDMEGIMAKKADSQYHPGTRTREWLKIKHHKTQEAIIAGFTEPGGSRKYFGALILAQKEGKELRYIGHTGSGFDFKGLKEMYARLKPLIQSTCPFKTPPKTNMPVTWVKPVLVCEMKYTEVTKDGHLRHPIFLRLREDKKAREVTTDSMEAVEKKPKKASATEKTENELSFGKIKVPLTNLKKIFWPKEGITKGDVIDYYQSVSNYILPYLKDRPQSLFRTPNGIDKPGFFHKDAGGEAPDWVESKKIFSESNNADIDYILCNNKATLAYLNNLGCIEVNPWHSTIKALDKPDYVIIDLDPAEKNTFEQVVETAQAVKHVLDKAGAKAFCKTSGATGLHIYIPMKKKYTYDQVKDFAHIICMMTNELLPDFSSLERNLKKRGNKMIYLDHLQNRKGQTIASVYSLRPKEGATVAMPLDWKEVKKGLDPKEFNIHTALKRIQKKGDIFKGVLGPGVDIAKCLKKFES
jgi:bifunctional non-homologous end joining protein LigD